MQLLMQMPSSQQLQTKKAELGLVVAAALKSKTARLKPKCAQGSEGQFRTGRMLQSKRANIFAAKTCSYFVGTCWELLPMWQNSRLISYAITTCAKPREAMVGGFGQAQLFLRHYTVKKQVFEQHVTKAARHTSLKTQPFMPLVSHDTNHISTRKHEYMATPALSCPRITPPLVTKRPDEWRT